MTFRIDIPLNDFGGLWFDGELWSPDDDYAASAGSAVVTIAAERLARREGGLHTLSAAFTDQTPEVVFTLRKTAAVHARSTEAPMPKDSPEETRSNGSLPLALVVCVAGVALAAGTFLWRARGAKIRVARPPAAHRANKTRDWPLSVSHSS